MLIFFQDSLTDTLFMETKPLGIKVMLVAPGSIRSNIANNASRGYQLPEGSLYKDYLPNIIQRIYASQQRPMAAEVFARKVVAAALRKDPPYYLTLGTNSTTFWILKNLFSRVFSLNFIWKYFSKKQI
jgi:short-subunit dehydrogenase